MMDILDGKHLLGGAVRWLVWGGAAALLLLPLVAMQFTAEVDWTAADFVVMGLMLLSVCVAYEVAARVAPNNAYVMATGMAVGACFLMVWANLAVGIVGSESNPVNDVFYLAPVVACVGAVLALFRPRGTAWAMVAAAATQLGTGLYVWLAGHGHVFVFTAVMLALWLGSARLFHAAHRA